MIEYMRASITKKLFEIGVDFLMLFDDEGRTLRHEGREIRGV